MDLVQLFILRPKVVKMLKNIATFQISFYNKLFYKCHDIHYTNVFT